MSINTTGSSLSESPARLPVDVRRFPWIRKLSSDYAYDFRAVAPFFTGDMSVGKVGVRYDATEIMQGVTEVLCYGTAVIAKPA